MFISRDNFIIQHFGVTIEKKFSPFSCIIISDLHYNPNEISLYSKYFNKFIIKLNLLKEQDDNLQYLFILGDLVNESNFSIKDLNILRDFLIKLNIYCNSNNIKLCVIPGNHDFLKLENNNWKDNWNDEYINMLFDTLGDSFLLDNFLPVDCNNVRIGGMYLPGLYYICKDGFSFGKKYNEEKLDDVLDKMNKIINSSKIDSENINILLFHSLLTLNDFDFFPVCLKDFDFLAGGHLHGGGIPSSISSIIPGTHGFVTPTLSIYPFDFARGIKNVNGTNCFSALPFRFVVNPQNPITKMADFMSPPVISYVNFEPDKKIEFRKSKKNN